MSAPRPFLTAGLALGLLAGCHGREEPVPAPRLVILLTVDTLRADHLGAYGNALHLTPHLDALAAESLVFDHAYAPDAFTLASVAALMTSRYPQALSIEDNISVLPDGVTTLAGWLAARGWRTGAVVSNYVLRRKSGLDEGFGAYDDRFPQHEANRPMPERVARNTTKAALGMLEELTAAPERPVFLWVHYQDPHGPYTPPEAWRDRFLAGALADPEGRRRLPLAPGQRGFGVIPRYQQLDGHDEAGFYRAGYRGEVGYVDQQIGRFLSVLEARGLEERTVLVFAADHGESLGENDLWFAHDELLRDTLVHVPLFVRVPGVPPGRRRDVASLLDVLPTLAALAGGDAPAGTEGRNLLGPGAAGHDSELFLSTLGVSSVPRFGFIAGGYKYLVSLERSGPREELFRLGDETRDLLGESADVVRALRARVEAARRQARAGAARRQQLSPEEEEQFRALGYVG